MSESIRSIDARGLACPQPVVLAKKALEEGGFEILQMIVDGPSARENVTRFAVHAGHAVESVKEGEKGAATIRIRRAATIASSERASTPAANAARPEPSAAVSPEANQARTIFISSDRIGSGDDELGALLMKGFIGTLLEASPLPDRLIFMNGGVRLAVEGSSSLSNLKKLEEQGMEILSCGTCLDFYKIKDKLAVGRVSNMFEISGLLLNGKTFSL
jgi:selenium metabolism protein YedF